MYVMGHGTLCTTQCITAILASVVGTSSATVLLSRQMAIFYMSILGHEISSPQSIPINHLIIVNEEAGITNKCMAC